MVEAGLSAESRKGGNPAFCLFKWKIPIIGRHPMPNGKLMNLNKILDIFDAKDLIRAYNLRSFIVA